MRILKIPLIIFALIFVMATGSSAQQYLNCAQIDESTIDLVRINLFKGRPGDTVWAPVYVETDSVLSGFKMLIEFDPTYLTPVIDAGLIAAILDGRFVQTITFNDPQTGLPVTDTITDFASQISQNPFDSGAILATYNLNVPIDSIPRTTPAGAGVIFKLGFAVDSTMPHGATASFGFHEVNEFYLDTSQGVPNIVFLDCRRTELALNFNTGTVTSYPRLIVNAFEADSAYEPGSLPVINTFTATPTGHPLGGGTSTLSWNVTDADNVNITSVGSVGLIGNQAVSLTATTTYTLTATNNEGSISQNVTVTVGTGGGNQVPVISFVPFQTSYTIEQGQTVNFGVTATDPDGDQVTLTATSLPNNANFSTAVGAGSASSNFSFTPDITQSGSYTAVFSASDNQGGVSPPAAVVIQVNALQFDRLFTTSTTSSAPVGGIAGKPSIYLPINLVTSQTVYGMQFDFLYDNSLFTVDSIVVSPRIPDYIIYDNIGTNPGQIKIVAFGLANEPVVNDDTTTAVMYAVMSIDSTATPGDYPVYLEDGWESIDPDPNVKSLPLVTDSGVIQVDNMGDVNLDKMINVGDLVNVVAYIIGNFPLSDRQFDVADVVIDTFVDVFDLVAIVNNIFGVPFSPAPIQSFAGDAAKVSLDYGDIPSGESDMVVIRSELPVEIAGVELEVSYDPNKILMSSPVLTADVDNMILRYRDDGAGKMKVLMWYADDEKLISSGMVDLIELPIMAKSKIVAGNKAQLRLSKALLSTSQAQSVVVEGVDATLPETFELSQNYPNPFNPTTTIEFSLAYNAEVNLNVYNILGQNVTTLVNESMLAGSHRIVWDATARDGHRVASGVYLYKLTVGDESSTKKMMFLK